MADKLKTQEEKLELFKDSMKGESVYVLSCGPSLMRNDMNKLKQLIKNKPVISIKQAFDYFKQETDIHIYNYAT